jgi:hypothetical protein
MFFLIAVIALHKGFTQNFFKVFILDQNFFSILRYCAIKSTYIQLNTYIN